MLSLSHPQQETNAKEPNSGFGKRLENVINNSAKQNTNTLSFKTFLPSINLSQTREIKLLSVFLIENQSH